MKNTEKKEKNTIKRPSVSVATSKRTKVIKTNEIHSKKNIHAQIHSHHEEGTKLTTNFDIISDYAIDFVQIMNPKTPISLNNLLFGATESNF